MGDLEPYHLAKLQQVSSHLQSLCLDNDLWKSLCFEDSPWYLHLINRRVASRPLAFVDDPQETDSPGEGELEHDRSSSPAEDEALKSMRQRSRRLQDIANWDPSFPQEQVLWYDEYIQRAGPACVNWLEAPRLSDRGLEAIVEARGVAMYSPYDGDDGIGTKLAVAPLDDGSVCLWDINGTRGRPGGIIAMSEPDLLYKEGFGEKNERLRSQKLDSSISDRVVVDNFNHKAYIAVQSRKSRHSALVVPS